MLSSFTLVFCYIYLQMNQLPIRKADKISLLLPLSPDLGFWRAQAGNLIRAEGSNLTCLVSSQVHASQSLFRCTVLLVDSFTFSSSLCEPCLCAAACNSHVKIDEKMEKCMILLGEIGYSCYIWLQYQSCLFNLYVPITVSCTFI